MARTKSTAGYIRELKEMIKKRTGKECEAWLLPQIRITAMNEVILDRLQEQLEASDMTKTVAGSMGQEKTIVEPLLPQYRDMQRTLTLQFTALGLNYNITPNKVKEDARTTDDEENPMTLFYKEAKKARQ